MTVGAISPGLRIMPADVAAHPGSLAQQPRTSSFGDQLHSAIAGIDDQGVTAQFKMASLVEGTGADVHDAMIAVQKADLSFQLMLQVRNKVVQAYQEIERMQF